MSFMTMTTVRSPPVLPPCGAGSACSPIFMSVRPRRISSTGPMRPRYISLDASEMMDYWSGEGDADRTVDLVGCLADRFTVVTYDRRGLSRSRSDDPGARVSIRQHADDAAAV